jgi:hypothetical protein
MSKIIRIFLNLFFIEEYQFLMPIFQSLDLERMLITKKFVLWKSAIFHSIKKATIWCASFWKNLTCYLLWKVLGDKWVHVVRLVAGLILDKTYEKDILSQSKNKKQ